jgi:hypothetical protein
MEKIKIRKKPFIELIKSSRVKVNMDTSQKIIRPEKGKGSYSRKAKHKKSEE